MSLDYSKFPFPYTENPHAANLTEGIRFDPVSAGFVVMTLKLAQPHDFVDSIRKFVTSLRASSRESGFHDITAYREIRSDELGGAIPFDQPICDKVLADAQLRASSQGNRFPAAKMVASMTTNPLADWVLLLEYKTHSDALAAAEAFDARDLAFQELIRDLKDHTVGAFKNTMQYAYVSRDPNLVQFFNLFPGPGDPEKLWPAWQDALPWFFESGEIRSSFPLVSLKPGQPLLIVNYAHCDSVKHFLLGVAYNPNFLETIMHCYADRGFKLPAPFFCKIVQV